jgi:D-alanyl-lipoteichoic acid acyltransferase DltB (MBOAT superfamily)
MKVVVADSLAVPVNVVYGDPRGHAGLGLAVATILFGFQIYCDFAGYSCIALGAAKVMGFQLMDNFRRPYFSSSVPEFWRRWHISLSTWFRDYVYLPLGGNRVSRWRWCMNLLVVFAVSGFWHGANWTFVIWGLLHGLYVVLSVSLPPLLRKLAPGWSATPASAVPGTVRMAVTFFLVCFAWIFFRAANVSDGIYIATHLFGRVNTLRGIQLRDALPGLVGLAVILGVETIQEYDPDRLVKVMEPAAQRWALYYGLILAVMFWGRFGGNQFIYFQF